MNFGQILLVINIGFIVSLINVLHVIIGYARNLPGQVYMATGHYYLDYFEYLQAISQGQHGQWLWENDYLTNIKFKTIFGMWQYVIFGKIGQLFHLSPIATYWGANIILSIILSVLIFFIIKKILINRPFYWQLAAYVLALFSAPFFKIAVDNNLKIIPYRFWNDQAVLINRFGSIPYHISAQIIILLIILITSDSLDRIVSLSKKIIIIKFVVIICLLFFLLSFSPASFLLVVFSLILTLIWLLFSKQSFSKIKFLGIILFINFPLALLMKFFYINKFFSDVSQTESGWQIHPPLTFVFLTTGPILLFFWLGFKNYFRQLTTIKIMFLSFVFSSYLLFFSPIAFYLRTTNMRFLSPLNYILLAVLTVAGIKKLKSLLIICLILLLLFIPGNIESIKSRINDPNLVSPISYLPKGIIDGFKYLDTLPGKQAILTTPAQFLGMIASIYSGKPVYLNRPGLYKYDEKVGIAAKFYWDLLEERQAKEFLEKNQIGFITLTSIENYPIDKLAHYKFLKNIYQNQNIVIYQKK
jgi:hypothetical protein